MSNEVIEGWSTSEKGWTSSAEAEEDSTHFRLPFGRDGIVLVDTKQAFGDFLRYLNTEPSYLFGLDTEFMGTFGSNQQTATLIQISGKNCVHLLDVVKLLPVLGDADWAELVRAFFMDDNVRILGYSLGSDYNALESVNPAFRGLMSKSAPNWLDLCQLVTRVCKGSERLFELPYDSQSYKGLGGLVKALFDSTLDKTYQVCDWRRRPMKPQQITYAATDAYVCLAAYQELENIAEASSRQVNFAKWVEVLLKHKNKLPKGFKFQFKKEEDGYQPQAQQTTIVKQVKTPLFRPSDPINSQPISPPELRVVCDTMLQGLCKKLRLHGVDAVALESHEYFENCARVAKEENRAILTRGGHAQKLQSVVGLRKEMCYQVQQDQLDSQLEEVFWYFNVKQDDKYLFSRCQKCNGDKYATLTSYQAEIIRQGQNGSTSAGLSPKKRHHNSRRGSLGRRNSQDLYGGFLDDEEDGEVEDDGEVRVPMNSLNLETYFVCGAYKVDKVTGSVKGTVAQGSQQYGATAGNHKEVCIQLKDIPKKVISDHSVFYGCVRCGKVFWEGSHWDRFTGGGAGNKASAVPGKTTTP